MNLFKIYITSEFIKDEVLARLMNPIELLLNYLLILIKTHLLI